MGSRRSKKKTKKFFDILVKKEKARYKALIMRSRRGRGKNIEREVDEKTVCFLGRKPLSLYVGVTFCNGFQSHQ